MKPTLTRFMLLLYFVSAIACVKAQTDPFDWKHYSYPAINLSFDLPNDFTIQKEDSVGMLGSNQFGKFSILIINHTYASFEEKRDAIYSSFNSTYETTDDPFSDAISANGYEMVGGIGEDTEGEGVLMLLFTDQKYRNLNFLVNLTYGAENDADSTAYLQAERILHSIGPIEK